MSATHAPIILLAAKDNHDGAQPTFNRVVAELRRAEHSVEIHMFVWRNDDIGNRIGAEVLAAAKRGVRILIRKDLGAVMYERIEMNRKSFFPTRLPLGTRLKFRFMGLTFPATFCEDDHDDSCGRAVMNHPNITVEWVDHTHTKYYIFDEKLMLTGSINIEDRHRGYNDYMVALSGEEILSRFRARQNGEVPFDPSRAIDFIANRVVKGKQAFDIKPKILELLGNAQENVYVEMAYIGDPDVTEAIAAAANRGVTVTFLFSRKANIGNDVNYQVLLNLYRSAPIEVYLTDTMIHSKLMWFDRSTVLLGSANISLFSMEAAAELDVVVRDSPAFMSELEREVRRRIAAGQRVESESDLRQFNRTLARLQQLHQKITRSRSRRNTDAGTD